VVSELNAESFRVRHFDSKKLPFAGRKVTEVVPHPLRFSAKGGKPKHHRPTRPRELLGPLTFPRNTRAGHPFLFSNLE
jgi:hypothetical protein